jgi:hypothetical protein
MPALYGRSIAECCRRTPTVLYNLKNRIPCFSETFLSASRNLSAFLTNPSLVIWQGGLWLAADAPGCIFLLNGAFMWCIVYRARFVVLLSLVAVWSSHPAFALPATRYSTTFSKMRGNATPAVVRQKEGRRRKAEVPSSTVPTFASLRVSSPEVLSFERGGYAEVRYVSVRVMNNGRAEARQLDLSLQVGEGLAFPLKGPKKLPPKGSAVYTSSARFPAVFAPQAKVVARCATCRS